ncbi:hypothetical protein KC926_02440 [Candidatus Kaiserbacteria bacterium]|nr:hypothetical protein [Candidatus Kaiserbacteria bacterium]
MLVIKLDEQAYEQAREKLIVEILNVGTETVPPIVLYEVVESELHSIYPVGTPVGFSIGIASETDQWLGCLPTRAMVKKLLQPNDLLNMRNPILPSGLTS